MFDSFQLNYSVIEKEALILIWALQHFEVYVGSSERPLVVYTDHNPFVFFALPTKTTEVTKGTTYSQ